MGGPILLLITSLLLVAQNDSQMGVISGTVVNGTDADAPVVGADVVLRAIHNGMFVPIDKTTTGAGGRFSFVGLRTDGDVIYLPGVNRAAVHYPGPRVRLDVNRTTAQVKLVAYDAIESPCPLVTRRHEIHVRAETGFFEIAETLVLANPTLTAFVGEHHDDHPPATLRLTLPSGFETVTFEKEFHGRQFQIHDGDLVTTIPWPPGQHELKFTYRLPIEHRRSVLLRALNQPTEHVIVYAMAKDLGQVVCNLPLVSEPHEKEAVFEQHGKLLPAGYTVELKLAAAPVAWDVSARWIGLALLVVLIAGSIASVRRRPWRPSMDAATTIRDVGAVRLPADTATTSSSSNRRIRGNGQRERQSSPADRPL